MIVELGYVLAGLLVIMIPGFLFSVVLFPGIGDMDFWKRMGVSLGLGTLLVIYQAAALARLKSMTAGPFMVSVVAVTVGMGIAAYLRRGTPIIRMYVNGAFNLPKRIPKVRLPERIYRPRVKQKPEIQTAEKPKEEKKCPSCAHPNPPDVVFCIECGKKLEVPESEKPAEKEEERDVQVQTSDRGEG